MPKIRIILADDHNLTRAGLRLLLEQIEGVEILGEADNGRDALALVRQHTPQLVLMDISMPELNGIEALTRISKDVPNARVIILSTHSDEAHVLDALRAGAAGYLLKNAATQELHAAVEAVAKGGTYLSPQVASVVIARSTGRASSTPGALDHLTSRQREILQLIAEGKSTKEMAFLLNVSVKTIETHRAQLMDRLNIRDIAGLVRYALKAGLVVE
jgi:DNA-binding NarL/FixJ family response regulator